MHFVCVCDVHVCDVYACMYVHKVCTYVCYFYVYICHACTYVCILWVYVCVMHCEYAHERRQIWSKIRTYTQAYLCNWCIEHRTLCAGILCFHSEICLLGCTYQELVVRHDIQFRLCLRHGAPCGCILRVSNNVIYSCLKSETSQMYMCRIRYVSDGITTKFEWSEQKIWFLKDIVSHGWQNNNMPMHAEVAMIWFQTRNPCEEGIYITALNVCPFAGCCVWSRVRECIAWTLLFKRCAPLCAFYQIYIYCWGGCLPPRALYRFLYCKSKYEFSAVYPALSCYIAPKKQCQIDEASTQKDAHMHKYFW